MANFCTEHRKWWIKNDRKQQAEGSSPATLTFMTCYLLNQQNAGLDKIQNVLFFLKINAPVDLFTSPLGTKSCFPQG